MIQLRLFIIRSNNARSTPKTWIYMNPTVSPLTLLTINYCNCLYWIIRILFRNDINLMTMSLFVKTGAIMFNRHPGCSTTGGRIPNFENAHLIILLWNKSWKIFWRFWVRLHPVSNPDEWRIDEDSWFSQLDQSSIISNLEFILLFNVLLKLKSNYRALKSF